MRVRQARLMLALLLLAGISHRHAAAEDYDAAEEEVYAPASPNKPWPLSFGVEREREQARESWGRRALLWLPNRLLDLIDLIRVDAGLGPAYGGVVRISRWGQLGYREMAPGSLRIGGFGRKAPVLFERKSEWGAGPAYHASTQRKVCDWEIGAGLDLLIAGGYAGLCFDALPDLLAGVGGWDPQDDDLR